MEHRASLRKLLAGPDAFVAPGCYDAFGGLLIEQAGFNCAYLSGASVAFSRLGQPDIGLTTLTEIADTVGCIRDRIELPLIVDADNGFGNALNVRRSVRLLERMGASALQIEDQGMPRRCGHLAGKRVIDTSEMIGKIRAAQDARLDPDLALVIRTDAIAVEGYEAGLERAEAYLEAGADVLFVEALESREQLAEVGQRFGSRVPLVANMVEGGRTPVVPLAELGGLGFRTVIYPGAMLRVVGFAVADYLAVLRRDGGTAALQERMLDFDGLNRVIGTPEMLALGQRYE